MAESKHPSAAATVQIDNDHVRVTEWRFQPGVPCRVAVNESVELVKMFGAEQGFRYVNAALDRLAKSLRPDALASP